MPGTLNFERVRLHFDTYLQKRGLHPHDGKPTKASDALLGAFMAGVLAAAEELGHELQAQTNGMQQQARIQVDGVDKLHYRRG
jgi:hypothetical protein